MSTDSKSASIPLLPEHDGQERAAADGWPERYKKLESLGRGACAEVFEAMDKTTGEHVAIKVSNTSTEDLRCFAREVEILRKLRDPNIVEILDAGSGWYAMPRAQGNLSDLAAELSDEERIEVIAHVAAGLAAVHKEKVVHRDVSPNNILRMSDGGRARWTISDFGMVRRPVGQTSLPATRGRMGTRGFMAPEGFTHGAHGLSHQSDIYSLGRTIAFMTTARWPHENEPTVVPSIWEPLVTKMTVELLAERFQHIDEVRDALPGVLVRLKAQRRAQFVEAPRVLGDLLPQERLTLRWIMTITTAFFREDDLFKKVRRKVPRRTITLGLLGLRNRGFLEAERDQNGEVVGERLTKEAGTWALANDAEIEAAPEPESEQEEDVGPPPPGDGDIPF